ncbi:MAG: hypothetical protein AB7P40_09740 [Chloroflexota bacterium]
MANGALLAAAQREGFQVLVTTDTNLEYQQHLAELSLSIVVLSTTSWPRIQQAVVEDIRAVDSAT